MRILGFIGLLVSISSVLLGHTIEGGTLLSLFQPAALAVVLGGTAGVMLMQSAPQHVTRSLSAAIQAFQWEHLNLRSAAGRLTAYAKKATQDTPLALDAELTLVQDPFMRKALMLVVDSHPGNQIRDTLMLEASMIHSQNREIIKFWESAAGYAPTIGILGSVLGLLHVMNGLENTAQLGAGIAVSFVATLYGLALANLVCLPVANRLKSMYAEQAVYHELCIEAASLIALKTHYRHVGERLSAFTGALVRAPKFEGA